MALFILGVAVLLASALCCFSPWLRLRKECPTWPLVGPACVQLAPMALATLLLMVLWVDPGAERSLVAQAALEERTSGLLFLTLLGQVVASLWVMAPTGLAWGVRLAHASLSTLGAFFLLAALLALLQHTA